MTVVPTMGTTVNIHHMRFINNKTLKNASWIITCKIIQSMISLLIGTLTARYLGPSNYGLINYAASLVAFVLPIMQLGLRSIMVHEFVNRPTEEGKILGTSLGLSLCSAFMCIIGVTCFSIIANHGEKVTIIICFLYSLCLIFQAIEMTEYWFQAKLLSKYSSFAILIAYTVISGLRIYLLATNKSVYWFTVAYIVDYALIAFCLLFFYKKNNGQKLSFSFELAKAMLKKSKFYIVSTMMTTIFQQTDKIMLKLMLNETETGYYSVAVTTTSMTAFIFAAVIDSMRPTILKNKKDNDKNYEKNISLLYSVITYMSLAQSILFTILANPIINILYGNDYAPSILLLRITVWYVTFSYYGMIRNIWILAEQKQKYLWIINLSGALINVGLNAVLIPFFGASGAAIASLATQFFTNVIINLIIRPIKYNNHLMKNGLNPYFLIKFIHTLK